MNPYFTNLNKIEFAVTYACTGKCKHCSVGSNCKRDARIDPELAASAVKQIASKYNIKTVMTFGGEPLLHTDAVYAILEAAMEMKIPKRQVITNGYFSKDTKRIADVASRLSECGVNDLLLSVDAFHQETIPLETVILFAAEAKKRNIPIRLQPAWLISKEDDNPYNLKTRQILNSFRSLEIEESEGNIVFPEGNALLFLKEYFTEKVPQNPYKENPEDIRCISFSPNGDVLCGNIYEKGILEIMSDYTP